MEKIKNFTDRICEVMFAAYFIWLAFSWRRLPEVLPRHFGIDGEPDSYGGKAILVIVPVVALILFLFLSYAEKHPEIWNYPVKVTDENRERLKETALKMMACIKTLLVVMELYMSVKIANPNLPSWPMILSVVIIFTVIILSIGKMIKEK